MLKEMRKIGNCLMELSGVEVKMNKDQLRAYRSGDLSLVEIKLFNEIEEDLEVIKENERFFKMLTFGLAFGLAFATSKVAHAAGLSSVDELGHTFLNIIRSAGKWIIMLKGLVEVIKEANSGGDSVANIGRTIMTYVLMFASLYILPLLFDLVQGNF